MLSQRQERDLSVSLQSVRQLQMLRRQFLLSRDKMCIRDRNVTMLNAIKKAFRAGMPTVAECGGFMYLHTYIHNICDDTDEQNKADRCV